MISPTQIQDEELDYHYAATQWARLPPNEVVGAHLEAAASGSDEARRLFDVQTISYGDSERQAFDVYHKKNTTAKGAPIFVFVHGGYWYRKALSREISAYPAVSLCEAGATVIALGYDLIPDVTSDTMVLQVRKAVQDIIKLSKERESSGIYLSGHSAGAHLCALALMFDFPEADGSDNDLIKGGVFCGGVYDVRPVVKTSINATLKLTEEEAWRFSPAKYLDEIAQRSQNRDLIIAAGQYDPPEFHRQSTEMTQALEARGVKATYIEVPDVDHFSNVQRLQEADFVLTKEAIRLMGL